MSSFVRDVAISLDYRRYLRAAAPERRGDNDRWTAGRRVAAMVGAGAAIGFVVVLGASLSPSADTPAVVIPPSEVGAATAITPAHLLDLKPTERYFNADASGAGAGVAVRGTPPARTVVIRPELDERRQGYVVYDLDGRYRTLSTWVGVSDAAPAGTTDRIEIYGDGRLLYSETVAKGAPRAIAGLDISGVIELKLLASSAGPGLTQRDPQAPAAVFVDPVLE